MSDFPTTTNMATTSSRLLLGRHDTSCFKDYHKLFTSAGDLLAEQNTERTIESQSSTIFVRKEYIRKSKPGLHKCLKFVELLYSNYNATFYTEGKTMASKSTSEHFALG